MVVYYGDQVVYSEQNLYTNIMSGGCRAGTLCQAIEEISEEDALMCRPFIKTAISLHALGVVGETF
jgi:hypothetical protein